MGEGLPKLHKGMSVVLELQRKSGLNPEPLPSLDDDILLVMLKTKTKIPIYQVCFIWTDNNWVISNAKPIYDSSVTITNLLN